MSSVQLEDSTGSWKHHKQVSVNALRPALLDNDLSLSSNTRKLNERSFREAMQTNCIVLLSEENINNARRIQSLIIG